MKKLFCLIFIVSLSSLFADSLKDATSLFNKKQYKKAYTKTQMYLKKNPLDIRANTILADCAYYMEDYDDAMAAYDRVLILDPNNIYAKMQESKIFAKIGDKDMSKLELDAILKLNLTDKQRESILKLKESMGYKDAQKQETKKPIRGSVSIGVLYDTNTNGDIGEKNFAIPSYNLTYEGQKEEDDFAIFENLYLNGNMNFNETLGLEATLNVYNRSYFDMHENDTSYLFFSLAPYTDMGSFKVSLPLVLNKIFLGHDSYLDIYGGGIDIKRYIQSTILEFGYRYYKNAYHGKNEDKDSTNQNVYAGMQYLFSKDFLSYVYLRYANNKEKNDLRNDVNYDSYGIDLGINKRFFTSFIARAGFKYKNYNYDDFNKIFENRRDDKIYDYSLGLTYNFLKSSSLSLDVEYIDKKSNQFAYEYDRLLTMLTYMYRFWKHVTGF